MEGSRILVVEDDPKVQTLCERALRSKGFDATVAGDGLEGLALARTWNPDCIVLDVMLPKMDGYKVCRMLKSDPRTKGIPIILHTARVDEKDKSLATQAGADAFVVKDGNIMRLLSEVENLLVRSGSL
jgi:DNA-binding response OmpR family regulator